MGIERRDITAVLQDYRVAVTVLFTAKDDFAVAGRFDRCTARCRVIDTTMCAYGIQDRMPPPRIETRAYAREVDRRTHECFSHAQSFGRVVVGSAVLVDITNCLESAPVVHEFGGDNLTIDDIFAILK